MFTPIGNFLDKAARRTGAAKSIKAAVIIEQAGPLIYQIMPQLRPGDFKVVSYARDTLTISTLSPTLAQEIKMYKDPLLEVFNDTFAPHQFKRLRFVPMAFDQDYN